MELVLLYNTGTYNTLYLTTVLKNKLMDKGHNVSVFHLEKGIKIDFRKYDYVGILSNIRYRNIPPYVIELIKELDMKDKRYFVITDGGFDYKLDNKAIYNLVRELDNNNKLTNYYHVMMPANYKKRTSDDKVKELIGNSGIILDNVVDTFTDNKEFKVGLIDKMLLSFHDNKARRLAKNIKRYHYDRDICIKCKKCSTNCPTKNIFYNWKEKNLEFGNNCIMCMRCSFNCPVNAIYMGRLEKYKVNGKYDLYTLSTNNSSNDKKQ